MLNLKRIFNKLLSPKTSAATVPYPTPYQTQAFPYGASFLDGLNYNFSADMLNQATEYARNRKFNEADKRAAACELMENILIYATGYFFKTENHLLFLDSILNQAQDSFKNEVFKLSDASYIMGVNMETLRRWIREGKIDPIEDETVNRVIYKITGRTIIDNCDNLSKKTAVARYYIRHYTQEALFIFIYLLHHKVADLKPLARGIFSCCFIAAYLLDVPKEFLPKEPAGDLPMSIADAYANLEATMKGI